MWVLAADCISILSLSVFSWEMGPGAVSTIQRWSWGKEMCQQVYVLRMVPGMLSALSKWLLLSSGPSFVESARPSA